MFCHNDCEHMNSLIKQPWSHPHVTRVVVFISKLIPDKLIYNQFIQPKRADKQYHAPLFVIQMLIYHDSK